MDVAHGRAAPRRTARGPVDAAESAALVGAGLLSVLVFPVTGLALLRRGGPAGQPAREREAEPAPLAAM